jgi:hypothetical protein
MKFLLIVLIGHFLGEMIGRSNKTETNANADEKSKAILHPAEFQLRIDP